MDVSHLFLFFLFFGHECLCAKRKSPSTTRDKWFKRRVNETRSGTTYHLLVSDSLTLTCRHALDIQQIKWFVNDSMELTMRQLRLVEGHRVYLSRGGKELDFDWVELRDNGNYSCRTTDETHDTFDVRVEDVQSLTDFRSPFNCMLAATLIICLIFLVSHIGKKGGIRFRK